MGKVTTAREACAIGKKHREELKENYFLEICRVIRDHAEHATVVTFVDQLYHYSTGTLRENDAVNYFILNPEQVQRLINMGYIVEKSTEDVTSTYNCEELIDVPFLYFWSKQEYKTTVKEKIVTLRKITISWKCEECDES